MPDNKPAVLGVYEDDTHNLVGDKPKGERSSPFPCGQGSPANDLVDGDEPRNYKSHWKSTTVQEATKLINRSHGRTNNAVSHKEPRNEDAKSSISVPVHD